MNINANIYIQQVDALEEEIAASRNWSTPNPETFFFTTLETTVE